MVVSHVVDPSLNQLGTLPPQQTSSDRGTLGPKSIETTGSMSGWAVRKHLVGKRRVGEQWSNIKRKTALMDRYPETSNSNSRVSGKSLEFEALESMNFH